MRWIFKTFWSVITVVMALVGLIYLPVDYLDREQAVKTFLGAATVGNRETLLVALCVLAICRIFYLELRQGTQGQSWQPVRKSLLRGLAVVFKKDKRIAEMKTLGDHPELQQILDSARAKHVLERINWSPIDMPPSPDFSDVPDAMKHDWHLYKQRVAGPTKILMDRLNEELHIFEGAFGNIKITDHILSAVENKINATLDTTFTAEMSFKDESRKRSWMRSYFTILAFNNIKPDIKRVLESESRAWTPQRINESSSRLRQLLQGTVIGIQL